MTNNIYQVIKEKDLNEIINDHPQDLLLIMYSSKTCGPCKKIKPLFINMSKENEDSFFVYIDINNYDGDISKYTNGFEGTPKFSFYFNKNEIAIIYGANEQVLKDTYMKLKMKILEKMREFIEQEEQKKHNENKQHIENDKTDNKNNIEKIELLKKLHELTQNGVELTKNYDFNSDYNELLAEYNYQMSLKDNSHDDNKKEEKIKKIQELNQINQMIQMQKIHKLRQLEQLQKLKQAKMEDQKN